MGLHILVPPSWPILEDVGLSNLDGLTHPGTAELADPGGGRLK